MQKGRKQPKKKWMKIVSVLLVLILTVGSYTPVTALTAENGVVTVLVNDEVAEPGNVEAAPVDDADGTAPTDESGETATDETGTEESSTDEIGTDESASESDDGSEDTLPDEGDEAAPDESVEKTDDEITFPGEEMLSGNGELPVLGQKSNNVTWSIDVNGKLTVEGSGNWAQVKPNDYSASYYPPWHAYSDQIKTASVYLENTFRDTNGGETDTPITSLEAMFFNCTNLTSVNFNNTDTRYVTNMSEMFQNCSSLTTINWGTNFTTAAVTGMTGREASEGMEGMFYGCKSLTSLDVSKFNTENVKCMKNMFCACESLTSLNLSNFNTANVKNMEDMFRCCYALKSLTLGTQSHKFVIGNGTIVKNMFYKCSGLSGLDLSQIDTSAATDLSYMFDTWTGVTTLNVSVWDTANVEDMGYLFSDCENLTSLTLGGGFVTGNVTDMGYIFGGCEKLTTLDISSFNTGHVTDMNNMFKGCKALSTLTWGAAFTTGNVENMTAMFEGCQSLTTLDVSGFNTAKVTNMSYMFKDCSKLKRLDLSPAAGSGRETTFDTSQVENMAYMFCNCYDMTSLNLGDKFYTSKVKEMYDMFAGCRGLTSLDLGAHFDTSGVERGTSDMFSNCENLTALNLGDHFDTSKVLFMEGMFKGCLKLKTLNLGNLFDTSEVKTMEEMFRNCWELESLDLGSKFDTSKVTNMEWMFGTCTSLKKLTLGPKFNTSHVNNMSYMFYRCDILTSLDLSSFDASNVTKADYMLSDNHEMTLIKCPRNLTQDVTLPLRSYGNEGIYWMDDNGVEYTKLPQNLTKSITLVRSDREEDEEVEPEVEETIGSETRTRNSSFRVTYEKQPGNETVNRYFRTYIGVANYINEIEKDLGETSTYNYTITYLKESSGHDLYFEDGNQYISDENKDWRFEYRAISKAKSITYDYEKNNGNDVCFACTMDTKIPLIMKFDNVFFKQQNYGEHKDKVLHKLGKVTYEPRKMGYDYRTDLSLDSNMEIDELTVCGDKELWIDAEPTIKIGKLHMGSGRIVVTDIWKSEDAGKTDTIDRSRLGTRTIDEITTDIGMQYVAVGMPDELKDNESVDCFKTRTNPEDINLKLRDAHEREYATVRESTETVDNSEVKYYTMTVCIGEEAGGKDNYQYKVIYDGSASEPISTWAEVLADIQQNAGGKAVTVKPVKKGYLWSTNADWDWKEALEGFPTGINSLTMDFTVCGGVSIRNIGSDKVSYPVTLMGKIGFLYDENIGSSREFSKLTVEGYHTSLRLHCNLKAEQLVVKNDIPVYLHASQREMENETPVGDIYGRLTVGTLDCSQTPGGKIKLDLAGYGYKVGDAILTTESTLTTELYEYTQNESDEFQYDVTLDDSDGKYALKLEACYLVVFEDPNHNVVTPPSQRIKPGGKVAKVPDPVLDGWTFMGWYKDKKFRELWDFDNDTVNSNITLYAKLVKDGSSESDEPEETVSPEDIPDTYYDYDETEQTDIGAEGFATISTIKNKVYDGKPYLPTVKVTAKIDGKKVTLTEGTDYRVLYEKNVNAGNGKVIIKGNGLYKGEKEASFKITPKSMGKLKAVAGSMMEGASGQPVINIYDGSKLLSEGTDYQIEPYENLTAAKGNKKLTVKAIEGSNYAGTLKVTVKVIRPAKNTTMLTPDNTDVALSNVSMVYTGSACKPSVTVTYGGETLAAKHYSVKYTNNTNVGMAYVTVTGKSGYCGSIVTTFRITRPSTEFELKKGISTSKFTYNGKLQKPKVTVRAVVKDARGADKTKTLKAGKDYVITYRNNLHANQNAIDDTAKSAVIIQGIGNYAGVLKKEFPFTIQPQKINKATVKGTKGALVLTYAKKTLKPGTDYDQNIVYGEEKNKKVPATINGLGDFTDTVTKKVKVE